jgi:hypothetical protein
MAITEMTDELWEKFVDGFRRNCGRPKRVASRLGATYEQAVSFWEYGLGKYEPIKATYARLGKIKKGKNAICALPVNEKPPVPAELSPVIPVNPARVIQTHTDNISTAAAVPRPLPESRVMGLSVSTALDISDPEVSVNAALAAIRRDLAKALPREALLVHNQRERAMGASNVATMAIQAAQARMKQLLAHVLKDSDRDIGSSTRARQEITALLALQTRVDAAVKASQESTRLLVGLPQSITATVGAGPPRDSVTGGFDAELISQLEALRRHAQAIESETSDAPSYSGEESGE